MKMLLFIVLIAGLAAVALMVSRVSHGAPQPCPGTDPRNCQTYGNYRDMWLLQVGTFGNGEGDIVTYSDSPTGPMQHEYVCSDSWDNDLDGRTDFPSDAGCANGTDTDESNGPPEPPAPPPVPPPPPPGAPPPPPEPVQHDRITIELRPQGNPNVPPVTTCVDDLYSGIDLARLPVYAYYTDHITVCDDAMAQIQTNLCSMKALAPFNSSWFPITCVGRNTIANFYQHTRISRRCRQTQTRFSWRGESILFLRDIDGNQGSGAHASPTTPASGNGMYCR